MNEILTAQGVTLTDQWRLRIVLFVLVLEVANWAVSVVTEQPSNVTINTVFTTTIGLVLTDGMINKKKSGDQAKIKERENG